MLWHPEKNVVLIPYSDVLILLLLVYSVLRGEDLNTFV